ncbi:MAG TPA: HDIG domain-containing protein, partial [Clostridia bacterium]|nr:HDIG domain-containing protein [Clostridia bacterium]
FPLVAILGSTIATLFTRRTGRHDNYAQIILATSFVTATASLIAGLLQKSSWGGISAGVLQATISGALSVIIGIGIMPLFELIFNTVSPLRLIELSQPGHPLMKRLFVEAPGTSQHSMMVANLADTAAEAVGANAMIARVGAYFHDVGKLEAPLMFTENQTGDNPHDRLPALESARIITRHPEDSLVLGKRYRLPQPLLRIANEHHGTTLLSYFWNKALEEAKAKGEDPPPADLFRYRTPLPSSRESAIVMLADSVEAAMRSEQVHSLEEAESLIGQIIRDKIDQDQLRLSGLSFADIDTITQSFLQVYAGHFHERVPYKKPGRPPVRQLEGELMERLD